MFFRGRLCHLRKYTKVGADLGLQAKAIAIYILRECILTLREDGV